MNEPPGMGHIERETYLAYYRDGLLDLLVGLSLIGASICILLRAATFGALLPVCAIVLYPPLKKGLTRSRLGYVKFSPFREIQMARHMRTLVVLGLWMAAFGLLVTLGWSGRASWQGWIRSLGAIPIGVVTATAAVALGLTYEAKRGFVYAAVIIAVFVGGHLLDFHLPYQLLSIGAFMSVFGVVLLARFLQRHPKRSK